MTNTFIELGYASHLDIIDKTIMFRNNLPTDHARNGNYSLYYYGIEYKPAHITTGPLVKELIEYFNNSDKIV